MKVSATTLPRRSASAPGLPSCEVNWKGGAGPMTGNRLSAPASCAIDNAGQANIAIAKRNPAKTRSLSLPDRENTGKNRIPAGRIAKNNSIINILQTGRDVSVTPRQGNFDKFLTFAVMRRPLAMQRREHDHGSAVPRRARREAANADGQAPDKPRHRGGGGTGRRDAGSSSSCERRYGDRSRCRATQDRQGLRCGTAHRYGPGEQR